jgi:nucleoside 2-deoxyribosyltransferase
LCSLGTKYGLLFVGPNYLDRSIYKFANILNCDFIRRIGKIDGAPNIMLIGDRFEAGDQMYNEVLRDQYQLSEIENIKEAIIEFNPTDVIFYPIAQINNLVLRTCNELDIAVHIDVQYEEKIDCIKSDFALKSLIISSSSKYFLEDYNAKVKLLIDDLMQENVDFLVFKENRGGSRIVDLINKKITEIPCFPIEIDHSVGVGDCFNSVFITYYDSFPISYVGNLASYIASFYAGTYVFDEFSDFVSSTLKFEQKYIESLKGQRLAWEDRIEKMIYIAAPDFPSVNTEVIDKIERNLTYHGFKIFRPIKENGLIDKNTQINDEENIFYKDIKALQESNLMIAVLLYDDPGTLVEIGYFFNLGKPIILFDPNRIAKNSFLKNSVNDICYDLKSVTGLVFKYLSRGD